MTTFVFITNPSNSLNETLKNGLECPLLGIPCCRSCIITFDLSNFTHFSKRTLTFSTLLYLNLGSEYPRNCILYNFNFSYRFPKSCHPIIIPILTKVKHQQSNLALLFESYLTTQYLIFPFHCFHLQIYIFAFSEFFFTFF